MNLNLISNTSYLELLFLLESLYDDNQVNFISMPYDSELAELYDSVYVPEALEDNYLEYLGCLDSGLN